MKTRSVAYIISALCLLLSCATKPVASSGWPKHECGEIPGIPEASYCYDESGTSDDVLWFFHGLKDSKEVWIKPTSIPSDYPELISSLPPFRIITISWGDGWLLTNDSSRILEPRSATLENFKKVEAYLKNKYHLKAPYKLMGHSMGGANAAFLLNELPEYWSRAILINPMLVKNSVDPWNLLQLCPACLLLKYNYNDLAHWKANRPKSSTGLPPALVTACPIDVFGLYPGAEEYVVKSRKLKNKVTFAEADPLCSHWRFDVKAIVGFLNGN